MIIGRQRINEAVRTLHAHPIKTVILTTGGGVGLVQMLWEPGGMSNTVLDISCPYHRIPLADELRKTAEDTKCCRETAMQMAAVAFEWAGEIAQRDPNLHGVPLVGLGLTAALATDRERRGTDRVHIAALGPNGMRVVDLVFEKGRVDRVEQGRWCDQVALSLLLDTAGLETITFGQNDNVVSKQLSSGSYGTMILKPESEDGRFIVTEDEFWDHPLYQPDGRRENISQLDPEQDVLYPGSYNPIQYGHVQAARMTETQTGKRVVFSITANHPNKGQVPINELMRRRTEFRWRHPVLFTPNDPLYIDKARAFPGFSFLIGADVMLAILNEKYYGGRVGRNAVLEEFRKLKTSFLVVGRISEGEYRTLDDIDVPDFCRYLFKPVTGRWDISSTALR